MAASTTVCPACYVGLCKRHLRQDSGAGLKAKGPADKASTISRLYDDLIEKKLAKSRMEAAAEREAEAAAEAAQVRVLQRCCAALPFQPSCRSLFSPRRCASAPRWLFALQADLIRRTSEAAAAGRKPSKDASAVIGGQS